MNDEKTIKVLYVAPMQPPWPIEIGADLKSMQDMIGGEIEELMPFGDEVALICNRDGSRLGLHLNRAIYRKNGVVMEIIAGSFILCSAPFESEEFESLTDEQQKKYNEMFKHPECFIPTQNGIKVLPVVLTNDEKQQ